MSALEVWLQFLALSSVIGFAGYHLSIQADQIAEKTGLGKNLIGIILLATVTSLPELMTGVSSVTIADNPNLAVGNLLGSCVFNLGLVFLLDAFHREGSIYARATQGHLLTAVFGIILIGVVGFALAVRLEMNIPSFFHMGIYSLLIPVLYMLAMKFNYKFEKNRSEESEKPLHARKPILKNSVIFTIMALMIIAAGTALPRVGENIITVMGWDSGFVGTVFMAFATVLPEIAVTISAIRLNAYELAFSNLLGSNLFNVAILAVDDLFYTKGPILSFVETDHLVTVFSALLMTGVAALGLINPPEKRILNTTSYMSMIILLLFIINAWVVYQH